MLMTKDTGGFFFFQAEDGIRNAQESRGLGDVYKRQSHRGHIGATAGPQRRVTFSEGESG